MENMMNMPRERVAAGERMADALHLDGNALAGLVSEIFVPDITAARATCSACGTTRQIGALLVYATGMGMIARCPNCDSVVLRIARTPTLLWLDMSGATRIVTPAVPRDHRA